MAESKMADKKFTLFKPPKHVGLAPVYVRRTRNDTDVSIVQERIEQFNGYAIAPLKSINRETFTQTSKTILELARLERQENQATACTSCDSYLRAVGSCTQSSAGAPQEAADGVTGVELRTTKDERLTQWIDQIAPRGLARKTCVNYLNEVKPWYEMGDTASCPARKPSSKLPQQWSAPTIVGKRSKVHRHPHRRHHSLTHQIQHVPSSATIATTTTTTTTSTRRAAPRCVTSFHNLIYLKNVNGEEQTGYESKVDLAVIDEQMVPDGDDCSDNCCGTPFAVVEEEMTEVLMDANNKLSSYRQPWLSASDTLRPSTRTPPMVEEDAQRCRSMVEFPARPTPPPPPQPVKSPPSPPASTSTSTSPVSRVRSVMDEKTRGSFTSACTAAICQSPCAHSYNLELLQTHPVATPSAEHESEPQPEVISGVPRLLHGRRCTRATAANEMIPYTGWHRRLRHAAEPLRCTKSEILASADKAVLITGTLSSTSMSSQSGDSGVFLVLNRVRARDYTVALCGLAEVVDVARASGDPYALAPYLTMVNQRLLELLRSPRTHVARTACQLAGHFFEVLHDTRRPEYDDIVNTLLNKTADTNRFIREEANLALDAMVTHMPTYHAVRALCAKGPTHRNPLVRAAAARLIICVLVIAGPTTIMTHLNHDATRKRIIENLVIFVDDKNAETRNYGLRLHTILAKEGTFDFYARRYLSRSKHDVLMAAIQAARSKNNTRQ